MLLLHKLTACAIGEHTCKHVAARPACSQACMHACRPWQRWMRQGCSVSQCCLQTMDRALHACLTAQCVQGCEDLLRGSASTFKDLDSLLALFAELGAGSGTMYVLAEPSDPARAFALEAAADGRQDLRDPATSLLLSQYLADSYLLHPRFRCARGTLFHAPETLADAGFCSAGQHACPSGDIVGGLLVLAWSS